MPEPCAETRLCQDRARGHNRYPSLRQGSAIFIHWCRLTPLVRGKDYNPYDQRKETLSDKRVRDRYQVFLGRE
jgi:hypothetical protein